MTKRTLLQVARQLALTDAVAATDLTAIAEYSRNDDQRDYLAYCEMIRYSREDRCEAFDALDRVFSPAYYAMRDLNR